jgi:hypothetical protein
VDVTNRSALLEVFRRGEVPRDARLLAARAELPLKGSEQLSLLLMLSADADEAVADTASQSLDALAPRLRPLASSTSLPDDLRRLCEARGWTGPAGVPDVDPVVVSEPASPPVGDDAVDDSADESDKAPAARDLSALSVPEKLKVAMRGNREQRALLIRDPNKVVSAAVLSSPKLTDTEIEGFARMANVAEEVLRVIGANRSWTRSYAVASALVKNPKAPLAVSLPLIPRLNERDIKGLSTDRNVPEAVRLAARKFYASGQARRGA